MLVLLGLEVHIDEKTVGNFDVFCDIEVRLSEADEWFGDEVGIQEDSETGVPDSHSVVVFHPEEEIVFDCSVDRVSKALAALQLFALAVDLFTVKYDLEVRPELTVCTVVSSHRGLLINIDL